MAQSVLIYFWYFSVFVQAVLSLPLLLPFILFVIYYVLTSLKIVERKTLPVAPKSKFKFGVIVTAHKETQFIPPIVDSILKQTYGDFEVFVVADGCDISGLKYRDHRIHILKPESALNSNTRSIQYAIDRFADDIEVMVIFDPDNLVHPQFLEKLNQYYAAGYKAVQGNLYSKNYSGTYEIMDSLGVIFYNFIDRDVRSLLGLSVNIWGCGVSVLCDVYRKICYDSKSNMGGFDKHMQAEIAMNVSAIAYAPEAILYDEKISDSHNLEKQRIRWINAYFNFLSEGFNVILTGIKRRKFNLVFFGFNLIRPPYFLQILIAIMFLVFDFFASKVMFTYWLITMALFLVAFFCIILFNAKKETVKGLWFMPLFFFHQVRSLLKLRLNKKSILKTEHFKVLYIDDILNK